MGPVRQRFAPLFLTRRFLALLELERANPQRGPLGRERHPENPSRKIRSQRQGKGLSALYGRPGDRAGVLVLKRVGGQLGQAGGGRRDVIRNNGRSRVRV